LTKFNGLFCLIFCIGAAAPALAQDDPDKKFLDQEKTKELEQEPTPAPESQDLVWDWGGWINMQYLSIEDDPFESRREQRFHDLRLWGAATIEKRYRVYARLRSTFQDYNDGDQFGTRENEWDLFRLDQGYLEASWPECASKLLGAGSNVHVRAGRQYLAMGTGLLFNGVVDGIELDGQSGPWSARLFGALTIHSHDDMDRSLPDRDFSDRRFIGLDIAYAGFGAHRPYALMLIERDRNEESDPVQDYDYNANYFALGSRGTLYVRGLGYHVEAAYEYGRSVAAGTVGSEHLGAWAFLINLDYYAPLPTSPLLFIGLWWATGDKDRTSPTDTTTGNLQSTNDEGFLPFGYLQTGFALSPQLANIHILRMGGTFKPLENLSAWTKTLELGFSFYLYSKDQSAGGISDPRAFNDSKRVGSEIDLFMRWRLLSDLGVSMNYGHFMPGGAYDDRHGRDFFSMGLTYSF